MFYEILFVLIICKYFKNISIRLLGLIGNNFRKHSSLIGLYMAYRNTYFAIYLQTFANIPQLVL